MYPFVQDRASPEAIRWEMHERLEALDLHNLCSWNPEKISKRDQYLVFHCLKHDTLNRTKLYPAVTSREIGRASAQSCPGCRECQKESLRLNAAKARAARDTVGRHDRYDTFEKHIALPDRAASPCRFYVVRLTSKFIKFGIAKDLTRRAYTAQHQGHPYRETLFLSDEIPRAKAWAAEQFVNFSTLAALPTRPPKWLSDGKWAGHTEVRQDGLTSSNELTSLFWQALDNMSTGGRTWHSFYIEEVAPLSA